MDFLKFILIFGFLIPVARAELTGGEVSLDSGAGPGSVYSLGTGADLRFDTGDLHFDYTKQLSPEDPSAQNVVLKHTDNWTGGFQEAITDSFTLGLDYDTLSDTDELLYSDGMKFSVNYDWAHLSFRYARSQIDKNFLVLDRTTDTERTIHGAFVYQATIETSVDLNLSDRDTLSPTVSYSFFNPDVDNFAALLSKRFSTTLSNFNDTLQSFETWSVGATYNHEFDSLWSASAVVTVSHLIVELNPAIELYPSVTRKWSSVFSTQLGVDYNYIPGTPVVTLNLGLKYSFETKNEKAENKNEKD
jgi:hypothetical protein